MLTTWMETDDGNDECSEYWSISVSFSKNEDVL